MAVENTQKKSPPPKPTSSALVPVGVKGTDLVEEEIDERILAILGIQDVFDFTYEEYATLLKEKAMSARMAQGSMSTESIELVTDEFKRVKNKTGRFKVKAKKVDINKIVNRTGQTGKPSVQLDPTKLLPPAIQESQDQQQEVQKDILDFLKNDLLDALRSINSVVTDILDILREQRAIDQKKAEQSRREAEIDKKRKTEAKLEGGEKDSSSFLSNVAKPFTNFFDTIKNFFMNILMGSAINFLLAVLKDPSIILTPLKNFANMIIGFLNGIIGFLWNLVVSPINFVIGSINAGISGLISQINNAIRLIPGAKPVTAPQLPTIPGPPQIPMFAGGGEIDKQTGLTISGFGKDTQLTALSPGEVVFSNPAADFWGRDNLLAMNSMGGGTNKPKFGALGGIQRMQGGGMVGSSTAVLMMGTNDSSASSAAGNVSQAINTLKNKGYSKIVVVPPSVQKGSPYATIGNAVMSSAQRAGVTVENLTYKGSGDPYPYAHLDPQSVQLLKQKYKGAKFIGDSNAEPFSGSMNYRGKGSEYILQQLRGLRRITPSGVSPSSMNRGISPTSNAILDQLFGRTPGTTANMQAQLASGKSPTAPPPPTRGSGGVAMLPVPVGGGQQAPTSSSTPGQPNIPSFSSEDPLNMSTLVVKAIYNMVG